VSGIRLPVAAGRFYPAHPDKLASLVDHLLAAPHPSLPAGELRALVAPHAGYVYSGAVAGAAFAAIPPSSPRVALLGPSHFSHLRGAAVTSAAGWQTPLGTVPVDRDLRVAAIAAGAVADDEPHRDDHALEVELPFLQRKLGRQLRVLPCAVGGGEEAAAVIEAISGEALIVVSSDLSHYHDQATACRLDRATVEAVQALDHRGIGDRDACGAGALRGLLIHARRIGWTSTLLDLRTSGDTSGDFRSVVGYAAFAFIAPSDAGARLEVTMDSS
jgi:MEMO1 family protein